MMKNIGTVMQMKYLSHCYHTRCFLKSQKIMKYCTFNKLTLFIYTHNKQIIHSDLNNKIITVIQSQQYLDTGSNDTCRLLQR